MVSAAENENMMLQKLRRVWQRTGFGTRISAGVLSPADWRAERAYWQPKLFGYYRDQLGLTPHPLQSAEVLVPPTDLATRIQNTSKATPDAFFGTGYRQAWLYLQELQLLDIDPRQLKGVLEFGVGFGRLLIQYLPLGVPLAGCDVTPEVIEWANRGLSPVADLRVTTPSPPLPYNDGQFGFVYANSVFTHIPLSDQLTWARELTRITTTGGAIIASYLDANCYLNQLTFREFYDQWEGTSGFEADRDRGVQMTTYLSDAALHAHWSQVGEVVAIRHHFREQKHVVVRRLADNC